MMERKNQRTVAKREEEVPEEVACLRLAESVGGGHGFAGGVLVGASVGFGVGASVGGTVGDSVGVVVGVVVGERPVDGAEGAENAILGERHFACVSEFSEIHVQIHIRQIFENGVKERTVDVM